MLSPFLYLDISAPLLSNTFRVSDVSSSREYPVFVLSIFLDSFL